MTSASASTCRGFVLALLSFVLLAAAAPAQPVKVRIEQIKVGFPSGMGQETRFKSGAWTPIYVDFMASKDLMPREAELLIDTADSDNILNRYRVEIPAIEGEQSTTVMAYVRTGNMGSEITVSVRNRNTDRILDSARANRSGRDGMAPDSCLYLVAGSRLSRFRQAVIDQKVDPNRRREVEVQIGRPLDLNEPDDLDILEKHGVLIDESGWRRQAFIDRVEQLPTRWFGYQSVDVVLLTTGKEERFIKGLVEEKSGCKEALVEWVRRGGKLVLSVGHNHQWVNQLLTQTKFIDCEIKGSTYHRHLSLRAWTGNDHQRVWPAPGIEVALLQPGKNVEVLVRERDFPADDGDVKKVDAIERPMMVQAPCGLGRVILVAVDLEQQPFTGWRGQNDFYQKLKTELEPRSPRGGDQMAGFRGDPSSELAVSLQDSLESFEDIPVVSFGWVALFIFLYILVVGPLDYLFLKKVVKRLELTWITFPIVVLVVSTLAYFTAYYLKGNDLKINKIDLVDIDLHPKSGGANAPPQVHGHTWFTLFSPRIQNYTVGVEPAFPTWAPAPAADAGRNPYSAMVSWMGRPDSGYGGSARSGGQGLFKRTYTYAADSAGLEGVPIQVWATKSFSASWTAPMPAQPLFTTEDLRHPPGKPDSLAGSITNHLPVDLQDVVLLYRDHAYSLGQLTSGTPKAIGPLVDKQDAPQPLNRWFQDYLPDVQPQPQPISRQRRFGGPAPVDSAVPNLMKSILFHRKNEGSPWSNSGLRPLDQSWRLAPTHKDEVVLFGRIAPRPSAGAEEVTVDAISSTRLWLGRLPEQGGSRPGLAGTLSQRTYVRVFIPVAAKEQE